VGGAASLFTRQQDPRTVDFKSRLVLQFVQTSSYA
jgi:hypothetical protein